MATNNDGRPTMTTANDTTPETQHDAREALAREALAKLSPGARRQFLNREDPTREHAAEWYAAGLIDGGVTWLGTLIHDGWTCEGCGDWNDAGDEHYSAADCNETGRGVQLCEACATAREYEGTHAPGECQCGSGEPVCCTFATYDDGSTDEPRCPACCPGAPHLPRGRLYDGRVDAKAD